MKLRYNVIAAVAALSLVGGCSSAHNFARADVNKDGKLSKDEMEKVFLSAIFEAGDVNDDSKITLAEYHTVDPKYSEARFKERDINGNGSVTPQELLEYAHRNKSLDDLIALMDTNNDGYVTPAEAKAFNKLLQAQEGENELQKLSTLTQQ
jgi:Ca2+-binding EF-hand superfamily protein